jgi:cob(I)alamin adenosyltransferase
MDKAEARSVELAFNKAYTAAALHMATAELAAQAREPWMRSLMISHRGRMMPVGGALPILNGVTIVGAIGIAGATRPEQDALCCRAALTVWENPGH